VDVVTPERDVVSSSEILLRVRSVTCTGVCAASASAASDTTCRDLRLLEFPVKSRSCRIRSMGSSPIEDMDEHVLANASIEPSRTRAMSSLPPSSAAKV
jgi:hypothetical protein